MRQQHTRLNSRTSWATERPAPEEDEDLDETLAMVCAVTSTLESLVAQILKLVLTFKVDSCAWIVRSAVRKACVIICVELNRLSLALKFFTDMSHHSYPFRTVGNVGKAPSC